MDDPAGRPGRPMEVRTLRRGDVPAVALLMRAVADEERWIATPPGTAVEHLEARFARLADDPAVHAVVLVAGLEVVGVASLAIPAPRCCHGLGMAIAATHRGRGGGGLLLDELQQRARQDPAVFKVALEAWTDNVAAIGLYASRGFAVEGVLRGHYLDAATGRPRSSMAMGWWPADRPDA